MNEGMNFKFIFCEYILHIFRHQKAVLFFIFMMNFLDNEIVFWAGAVVSQGLLDLSRKNLQHS